MRRKKCLSVNQNMLDVIMLRDSQNQVSVTQKGVSVTNRQLINDDTLIFMEHKEPQA